jgi:hypothetical protein
VHGGSFTTHPNVLVQGVHRTMEDFSTVTGVRDARPGITVTPGPMCWTAPCPGWLKVNLATSFHNANSWMGFGLVVRDEKGEVVATLCKTAMGCLDPPLAEATNLLEAIKLRSNKCSELGGDGLE